MPFKNIDALPWLSPLPLAPTGIALLGTDVLLLVIGVVSIGMEPEERACSGSRGKCDCAAACELCITAELAVDVVDPETAVVDVPSDIASPKGVSRPPILIPRPSFPIWAKI